MQVAVPVGRFPAYGRWAEWNGKYRDCARKFLKGDMGQVREMSQRLSGSPDLYYHRGPTSSINFITCHDGFTLADVVSFNNKHNEANGEQNRDGANDNNSWNCGAEGPTDDPAVLALRRRQAKNALAMLFLSQGVPMLLMGDEIGRTQLGNNNAYCQDNELSWLDWSLKEQNAELFRFRQALIALRKAHPALRHSYCRVGQWRVRGSGDLLARYATLARTFRARAACWPSKPGCGGAGAASSMLLSTWHGRLCPSSPQRWMTGDSGMSLQTRDWNFQMTSARSAASRRWKTRRSCSSAAARL